MPPKKRVSAVVKIALEAGTANPASVGQALGPHGVNIMQFCKAYNVDTQNSRGEVIPAEITVFEDRSFAFVLKSPPAAVLLKKAAGVDKGAANPLNTVGSVSRDQVRQIAERKMADLNANDLDQAEKIISGTARSMGITVN
jgi:large subunit ribosomal protein L11